MSAACIQALLGFQLTSSAWIWIYISLGLDRSLGLSISIALGVGVWVCVCVCACACVFAGLRSSLPFKPLQWRGELKAYAYAIYLWALTSVALAKLKQRGPSGMNRNKQQL